MAGNITFTLNPNEVLAVALEKAEAPRVAVLADENTALNCLGLLPCIKDFPLSVIPSGEEHKKLPTAEKIWKDWMNFNISRHDIVVNVGGGVISDMGGFCASVFKRGLRCINIPTTVLAAVDASVGAKTALDFNGVKNIIGSFHEPLESIISTVFFKTLPEWEIRSGYAEILKHSLLDKNAMCPDADTYFSLDDKEMLALLERSVAVKRHFVDIDPFESGLRKCLNLGHTAGHAIEALALKKGKPLSHGSAVGAGLVCALVLSRMQKGLDSETLYSVAENVKNIFGSLSLSCNDIPELLAFMRSDKKNKDLSGINFTLLKKTGEPIIDCIIPEDDVVSALDITRDILS